VSGNREHFRARLLAMITVGRGHEWLFYGSMHVYLRIGRRLIDGNMIACVQLANLQVPEKHQGKGLFTALLADLLVWSPLPIYVEQVLNREFFDALLRRGFVAAREYDGVVWDVVLKRAVDPNPPDLPY
jgi:hypothetical protein